MPNSTGLTIKPLGALAAGLAQLRNGPYQAPSNRFRGVDPSKWPSPLQPINTIAPEGAQPLAFPLFPGQNLTYTPRFDAEYSAADLKRLATYPLARIIIENVKDSVSRIPWEIQISPEV